MMHDLKGYWRSHKVNFMLKDLILADKKTERIEHYGTFSNSSKLFN